MSAPDTNPVDGAGEQRTVDAEDNIASSANTLSTPSPQLVTTRAYDALVSSTEEVTTISPSTTTTTIDGEMNVDQATVALSFSNDAGEEVVDHAFALQFDALTGNGQHNELYESSPFHSDVAPSVETQVVENNQTNQDQPREDTLFQDNASPRNTKSIEVMGATTITMSSPTIQAVPPQPPSAQTIASPPLKPRQAIKIKKTQLPQPQSQLQTQHPIAPEQSPQALPTPQRKSPRRHIPTKGTGVVKKGTKRRHASTTPSPTTENVTTGGTTTLSSQVFSWNDILRVQNLIERCLQQCLSKDEIVATLQAQASVDPAFTAVIWQKLEEQNPSFFKAYTLQLQLKDQVVAFNYLMTQQKDMMAKSLSIDSRSSGYARHGAGGGMSARNLGAPSRLGSAGRKAQQKLQQQQRQQNQQHQSMSNEDNTRSNPHNGPSSGFHQSTFNSSHQSSLPLPSPIKTDLDTHAFFT